MNQATLLHRQVHPDFIKNGEATSQAFTPTPKDNKLLSAYDGDMITAEKAWEHYTNRLGLRSSGTISVSNGECHKIGLPVSSDPASFAEHVVIDFSKLSNSQVKTKAKQLKEYATARGWTFRP